MITHSEIPIASAVKGNSLQVATRWGTSTKTSVFNE